MTNKLFGFSSAESKICNSDSNIIQEQFGTTNKQKNIYIKKNLKKIHILFANNLVSRIICCSVRKPQKIIYSQIIHR